MSGSWLSSRQRREQCYSPSVVLVANCWAVDRGGNGAIPPLLFSRQIAGRSTEAGTALFPLCRSRGKLPSGRQRRERRYSPSVVLAANCRAVDRGGNDAIPPLSFPRQIAGQSTEAGTALFPLCRSCGKLPGGQQRRERRYSPSVVLAANCRAVDRGGNGAIPPLSFLRQIAGRSTEAGTALFPLCRSCGKLPGGRQRRERRYSPSVVPVANCRAVDRGGNGAIPPLSFSRQIAGQSTEAGTTLFPLCHSRGKLPGGRQRRERRYSPSVVLRGKLPSGRQRRERRYSPSVVLAANCRAVDRGGNGAIPPLSFPRQIARQSTEAGTALFPLCRSRGKLPGGRQRRERRYSPSVVLAANCRAVDRGGNGAIPPLSFLRQIAGRSTEAGTTLFPLCRSRGKLPGGRQRRERRYSPSVIPAANCRAVDRGGNGAIPPLSFSRQIAERSTEAGTALFPLCRSRGKLPGGRQRRERRYSPSVVPAANCRAVDRGGNGAIPPLSFSRQIAGRSTEAGTALFPLCRSRGKLPGGRQGRERRYSPSVVPAANCRAVVKGGRGVVPLCRLRGRLPGVWQSWQRLGPRSSPLVTSAACYCEGGRCLCTADRAVRVG